VQIVKVIKWLDKNFEEVLLMVFLVGIVLVMGVQVFMRYLLNESLSWSEELSRYLFVWSAFLSVSYTIRNDSIIRIDQLVRMLPPQSFLRKSLIIIVKVFLLVFFAYIFYYAIDVVSNAIARGQKSAAMGLPMYLVQASILVGSGLSVIRMIQSLLKGSRPMIDPEDEIREIDELIEEANGQM